MEAATLQLAIAFHLDEALVLPVVDSDHSAGLEVEVGMPLHDLEALVSPPARKVLSINVLVLRLHMAIPAHLHEASVRLAVQGDLPVPSIDRNKAFVPPAVWEHGPITAHVHVPRSRNPLERNTPLVVCSYRATPKRNPNNSCRHSLGSSCSASSRTD